MAALARHAVEILESTDSPTATALLQKLSERLIARTRRRWETVKFFGFSSRLVTLIKKNLALGSKFDRAIGRKAPVAATGPFSFGARHVPQLLWKDEFQRGFELFFPNVQESSARRFCAMALVKLSGDYTWGQSAAQLDFPVKVGIRLANHCITILGQTGQKELFGEALHEIAKRLSNNQQKVNYGRRREVLSTLSDVPTESWSEICRAAGITVGHPGRRSRYAAVWLWAELTGGDWRMAPGLAGENTESARTVFAKLRRTIIPKLASHLRAYGSLLLQAGGRLS